MPRKRYGSLQERIQLNVVVDSATECWNWARAKTPKGYGHFQESVGGRVSTVYAHRASYEAFVGPLPEGAHIDHLCRNRGCVNPQHLEPVTPGENLHRSPYTRASINRSKTECPHGHPYSGKNLIINRDGSRKCRTCQQAASRRSQERRMFRAAGLAVAS